MSNNSTCFTQSAIVRKPSFYLPLEVRGTSPFQICVELLCPLKLIITRLLRHILPWDKKWRFSLDMNDMFKPLFLPIVSLLSCKDPLFPVLVKSFKLPRKLTSVSAVLLSNQSTVCRSREAVAGTSASCDMCLVMAGSFEILWLLDNKCWFHQDKRNHMLISLNHSTYVSGFRLWVRKKGN